MNVGAAAFLVIVLFTVHEFEEIILVFPWIARHADDPRFARDAWISRRTAYPSTEAIAAMIAEEIILASLVLAIAVWVGALARPGRVGAHPRGELGMVAHRHRASRSYLCCEPESAAPLRPHAATAH